MHLLSQILALIILLVTGIFQVRNYLRYRHDEAANIKRALLALQMLCFSIHTIRLMLGMAQGYFFTAGVFCMLLVYTYWLDWIKEKRRR
jgi:uncharacterized membrane protein